MRYKKSCVLIFLVLFSCLSLIFLAQNLKRPYDNGLSFSYELTLKVERDKNIEICKYLNEQGEVTWAEDKKYACVVKTYNDDNILIREDYYDENGMLVYLPSGYCSVEIDERWPDKTYRFLNENNEPVVRKEGYAVLIRTSCSSEIRDYIERYYDKDMNPVKCSGGYFGVRYFYDGDKPVKYTRFDEVENPIENNSGCATCIRTYDFNGRISREMYFDSNNSPAYVTGGYYGIDIEYYDDGNRKSVTSLDVDCNPMINSSGYSTIIYHYRPNGTLEKSLYFDVYGNPCRNIKGAYGEYYDGEKLYYLNSVGIKYMTIETLLDSYPYIVVIAALFICLLFLVLKKKYRILLLIAYSLLIVMMTIMNRETHYSSVILNPLVSYKDFFINEKVRLVIIENIWLFIPYGVGLKSLRLKKLNQLFLFLVPIFIEIIQLSFKIGVFETADIFNNMVGELIGMAIYAGLSSLKFNKTGALNKNIN